MAAPLLARLALAACLLPARAAEQHASLRLAANPVRKVVTLLQSMQKKVATEGEAEEDPARSSEGEVRAGPGGR